MPDNSKPSGRAGLIDLARTEDFRLGALDVRPSLRQVEAGADSQTLEPRVMQVLIALAQRRGQVVPRDELVERCWDGRAVSEDAINRCIMRVRRLGESSGAFALDTITRVGYRMSVIGVEAPAKTVAAAAVEMGLTTEAAATVKHAAALSRLAEWLVQRKLLVAGVAAALVLAIFVVGMLTRWGAPGLERSIAVLPFSGETLEEDRAYLPRVIAGEIIDILAQLDGVEVIARNSSFTFGADADVKEVGHKLGVAHVLSGDVSADGDFIRVSATLADAISGKVLWTRSDRVPFSPKDVPAIQKEIAQQVAGAMSIAFNVPAASRLDGGGTQNLEAYDYYMQGLAAWWFGPGDPLDAFERATRVDPTYAEAWAGRAFTTARNSLYEGDPRKARDQQDAAFGMAQRAVDLAPDLGVTQASYGALSTTQGRWVEAEAATLKALELSRGELPLMHRMMLLTRVGRVSDALEVLIEFNTVDPLLGGVLGQMTILPATGRDEDLLAVAEQRGWFEAKSVSGQVSGLMVRVYTGQPASDIRKSLEALSLQADTGISGLASALLAAFDNPERARAALRASYEDPSFLHASKWELVPSLAAWYGDTDLVLRVWRDELPINTMRTLYLWDDIFSKARSRPEFKQLARDLGLADYWRSTRWPDRCRPLAGDDFACS